MYLCSNWRGNRCLYVHLLHEFDISRCDLMSIHDCWYAVSTDFFCVCYSVVVDFPAVCLFQTLADRMVGIALDKCCLLKQISLSHTGNRMYLCNLEHTLCQCSCLVTHNVFRIWKRLKVVRTFDQNTLCRCSSDPSEETQRYGYYQCTWAADNKCCKGSDDPLGPCSRVTHDHVYQRRKNCKCKRRDTYSRCVILCKSCDEVLWSGLLHAWVLDEIKYLGYGWLSKLLGCLDLYKSVEVDASTDDLITHMNLSRDTLSCECTCVEWGWTLNYLSVDRHLLARLYDYDSPNLNVIGINLFQLAILLYVRIVRADIHKCCDVLSALSHRVALEQLTNLIEQHNRRCLLVLTEHHGANRSYSHKEILVKYFSVYYSEKSLLKYIVADDEIRDQVSHNLYASPHNWRILKIHHPGLVKHYECDSHGNEKNRRYYDPYKDLFLFLCHNILLSYIIPIICKPLTVPITYETCCN